LRYYCYWKQS